MRSYLHINHFLTIKLIFLSLITNCVFCEDLCTKFDVSVTQKIENEGFHRELKWIVEISSNIIEKMNEAECKINMRLDLPYGMFVNPDEIADLNRNKKICGLIEGEVNIEAPLHEATEHKINIFIGVENVTEKISVDLPVHLRYQRAQITGGFGKVQLNKPWLLVNCTKKTRICGDAQKIPAPCSLVEHNKTCLWKNMTYQALFENVEVFVPIGDLDDYPLVSIVSLLLGCSGCVYILSILSTAPL